ncbi:hypothetical protein M5689_025032 [Euphorbia peplus]|nr:hypothetical protein M5689_025032 [Euphorbia peplus]
MWTRHPLWKETVAAAWTNSGGASVQGKIIAVSEKLSCWDRQVFGHVTSQVRKLTKELEDIQKLSDSSRKEEENGIARQLNEMLD